LVVKYIDSFQFYDGPVNGSEKAFGGDNNDGSTGLSSTDQAVSETKPRLAKGILTRVSKRV
jgi:hypothetical protein